MVAAIEGIVNKLQQVAVGVGSAHQNYAVNKFDGITEDADMWQQKLEGYTRLQNLTVDHYTDCFAFHVTGVAETWFLTLP